MEFVDKYPDKDWDWKYLSFITIEKLIDKYPDKPWDWENISMNDKITLNFIKKHLDKPWDWGWVSRKKNN